MFKIKRDAKLVVNSKVDVRKVLNLHRLFINVNLHKFKTEEKREVGKNYNPEIIYKQNTKIKLMDKLPEKIQNYLKLGRYDRPVGYMLLFWPCAWGLTLGAPAFNLLYFKYLSLFFAGSVLMRSSGCIINDMWDKDIDGKVERSKGRPLASGKITYKQAFLFLSGHLAISLWILLQLPLSSIVSGLGIMPVVIMYPYMKRVTHFPQFFLGLAFNSGAIIGFFTMNPVLGNLSVFLPLYCAGIAWTLIYDTIYAHMDKLDDIKINVKSTAIYFGTKTKIALGVLTIIMIGLFYYSLQNKHTKEDSGDYKYDLRLSKFLLLAGTAFQLYTIYKVDLNSPLSCLKYFIANNYFGFIIFLALLVSHMKKENEIDEQVKAE